MNRVCFSPTRRRLSQAAFAAAALCLPGLTQATPRHDAPTADWCGNRCDEVVIDWNQTAHQVIAASEGYNNPLPATRALAMTHLAMHDAVNAVWPRYATYALTGVRAPDADAALAAASAAHDVLLALYPSQKPLLQATLGKSRHEAGPGRAAQRGLTLGQQAAQAVLARRSDDGSGASDPYVEGNGAGQYRFTPGTDFILMPHWRRVTPFALRSPAQFRVAPPPALGSAEYARDFAEVKATGALQAGSGRSADQSHYAAFWYELSDAGWNRIARVVARERRQDLWQRARLFALLNVAMADAYIAGWDSKLHHNLWRPVTAIHQAATDGNPDTTPDRGWAPYQPTPPIQDHPSTHSALGAAAAMVLAHGFGSDSIRFSVHSPTAPPQRPSRRFRSFSEAAQENADSRVRAGVHFRFATTRGLQLGRQVGQFALDQLLQPVAP